MLQKILIYCCLAAAFISLAATSDADEANQFVDELLNSIRSDPKFIEAMDPMMVPIVVDQQKLWIDNGVVNGLTHVQRSTDSTVERDEGSGMVLITTGLAVGDISYAGHYRYKWLFMTLSGQVEAALDHIDAWVTLRLNKQGKGIVEDFQIIHFSGFHIKHITGTGLFNWLLRWIGNRMMNNMKTYIKEKMEKNVPRYLNETMKVYTFII